MTTIMREQHTHILVSIQTRMCGHTCHFLKGIITDV